MSSMQYHTLGYLWVTRTLSQCSSLVEWWGIIQPLQSSSYVSLPDPINLACGQYIIKCSFKGILRTVINRHRRGLPPWSLEYPHTTPRPFHSIILRFPLVAPPGPKIKQQQFIPFSIKFEPFISIKIKRVLHVSGTNHSSSTVSYN
jgi:hypothetical protein